MPSSAEVNVMIPPTLGMAVEQSTMYPFKALAEFPVNVTRTLDPLVVARTCRFEPLTLSST